VSVAMVVAAVAVAVVVLESTEGAEVVAAAVAAFVVGYLYSVQYKSIFWCA
jgi:hypothetical protein